MGSIVRRLGLVVAVGVAAVAGIAVGTLSSPTEGTPEPTLAIAQIPTSTPDLRTPLPTRTLTPTQAPTPSPSPSASPIAVALFPPITPSPVISARPTPTPEPRGRPVVFFAAPRQAPAAVLIIGSPSGPESDRVFFRLDMLRQTTTGPDGFVNLYATMKARLLEITVEEPRVVTVGFSAPNGDWGVTAEQVKLLLQQIVFTATEEPTLDFVRLTQNGGKPAVIAGQLYDKPLSRSELR